MRFWPNRGGAQPPAASSFSSLPAQDAAGPAGPDGSLQQGRGPAGPDTPRQNPAPAGPNGSPQPGKARQAGPAHWAILFLGAAILAFGLFNVHSQSGVTEGGVLGTTLLLLHWLHLSPALSSPILDGACYLLGLRMLGWGFIKNAVFSSLSYAACYAAFERLGPVLPSLAAHPLAAALLGGLFVGVGVGLVVREGGACGGDDALALVLSRLLRVNISRAYFLTDFVVLMLSLSYIPLRRILFSLLTTLVSSFVIERIQTLGRSDAAQP